MSSMAGLVHVIHMFFFAQQFLFNIQENMSTVNVYITLVSQMDLHVLGIKEVYYEL